MGQRELSELYVGSFPRLRLIPRQATLDGYFELLFAGGKYLQMFWQSAAIAGGISAGGILVSLFVGFALAQVPMRGKGVLRFTYTLMMMMPFQVTRVFLKRPAVTGRPTTNMPPNCCARSRVAQPSNTPAVDVSSCIPPLGETRPWVW